MEGIYARTTVHVSVRSWVPNPQELHFEKCLERCELCFHSIFEFGLVLQFPVHPIHLQMATVMRELPEKGAA